MLRDVLEDFLKENKWKDIYKIISELWISLEFIDYWDANWLYMNIFWENYIFVKKWLSKKMERFTLWHELCHFLLWESWFSINLDFHRKSIIEQRADEFSSHIFATDEDLKEAYLEYENIPTLSDIFLLPENIIEKRLNKLFKNYNFCCYD